MNATWLPRPRSLLFVDAAFLGLALTVPDSGAIGIALICVPILVYGWLGARIAERAPGNRIGWLLSVAALTAAGGP